MSEQLRRSQAQETRFAKSTGARLSPRSGARWDRKNDSRNDRFLFENKRTDNKRSITLKADDLEKLRKHAIVESRTGALQFDLNGRSYVVLTEVDFLTLAGLDE